MRLTVPPCSYHEETSCLVTGLTQGVGLAFLVECPGCVVGPEGRRFVCFCARVGV